MSPIFKTNDRLSGVAGRKLPGFKGSSSSRPPWVSWNRSVNELEVFSLAPLMKRRLEGTHPQSVWAGRRARTLFSSCANGISG